MKKNILKSLFVGMLCMLAASCQDTEELAQAVDSSKAQVVFSIAMDSPIARSRANQSWGNYDPTDEGTPKDNHIDINQFVVKMEIEGKEYHLSDIIKWKAEDEENVYQFVGVVNGIIEKTPINGAKISVFANMGSDEENLKDEFPYSAVNIPMWGVRTIKLEQNDENRYLAPGTRVDLGNIALLRAMAKMEVSLTPEMAADYDLQEVTLNKFNGTGNCFPTDYTSAVNTQDMTTTGVFNPLDKDPQKLLTFKKETYDTKDGTTKTSYIVYLPEVANQDNSLKVTVKLLPNGDSDETALETETAPETGTALETGTFAVMDYSGEASPVAIDIIRNHWYKYEISGFDAGEVEVNYQAMDWHGVDINVGGEGFLFLNKDVIEIYNSNIDADQLTFASSSPIKSIELMDLYNHQNNGKIVEGTADGVSAYYISKYGQKVQLGTDPGFDITDKDAALAREAVILSNIKATAPKDKLNGGITIKSPFLAEPANEIPELQQDSHFDTPRYLEFLVTNTQGQKATFRVVQYPAVVITNEEGFFSYRDDFCEGHHELGTNKAPTHYLNCQERAYVLAFLQNTEIHQVDPLLVDKFGNDYGAISTCPGAAYTFKELLLADGGNGGWYKSSVYPYGEFIRKFYVNMGKESQDQLVGVPYRDENYVHPSPSAILQDKLQAIKGTDRDFWWRKHYTGNMIEFFMSKVIKQVYRDGIENNGKGYKRLPGQADIYHHMPDGKGGWALTTAVVNVNTMQFNNNRMYHIKTQHMSDKFIIGYPEFVANDSVLIENKTNANLVSPSFMVASQLGTTEMPVNDHPGIYEDASPQIIYDMAKIHCKQYVEAKFEDTNGNGKPEPELGEKVTYYRNWRLPTKAEIDLIIEYQNSSRAMDVLLTGQRYACVTGEIDQLFSDQVDGYVNKGYFMRCVRDVKPDEN